MIAAAKRLAARIDAMTLRERALLLGAVSLIAVAAAYVLLIDAQLGRHRTFIDQFKRNQTQLAAVRSEFEKLLRAQSAAEQDPEQVALAELERRLAEIERSLAAKQRALVAPERLPSLLRDLLASERAVKLESLRVLPAVPLQEGAAKGEAIPLYRHGVELTLRGSYLDLLRYLEELEKPPARLLWGRLDLHADPYPDVKLTLTVQTISPQRSLLSRGSGLKAD